MGSSYGQVKPETIRIVFAASLLSMRNYRVRSKTWLAQKQNNVSEWSNVS